MNEAIYYILGTETATLMQIKDKFVQLKEALKELEYSNDDISCHICLHHSHSSSYIPIIEVTKKHVINQTNEELEIIHYQLKKQLLTVKVLNNQANLHLPIIKIVEDLLNE